MTGTASDTAVRELRSELEGRVLRPGDAGYDDARTLFNTMIDARPAVIAQCADVEDVRMAVSCGRENGLVTAVRSGGHSVAGMSTVEDGLVIDVRGLTGVEVDPDTGVARCGAGVTWAQFDAATQAHGLATTGGRVSTTGVSGLTLGGGSGWLERKHGLTCDSLRAVELVTAGGDHIRASRTEHPELFWALHGGGGNFGVATAFEFDLHPLGPTVLAGLMLWPGDRGRAVVERMREQIEGGAPDELGVAAVYITGPPEPFVPPELHGTLCIGLAFLWAGEYQADGEELAQDFRELRPAVDLVGPMPYTEFQSLIDDPPGLRNYWTADYLGGLPNAAVDAFVDGSELMPVPSASQSILMPWGGAVARAGDTPMAHREAPWVTHPFALWDDDSGDVDQIGWARAISGEMKRFSNGGVYLNFIGNEGRDRVRAAFGGAYERLARVKGAYDPHNFFQLNANIEPATVTGVSL
ncbi:MAG TPA: FAD-binding oxidoreductase [Conexibacter sp.]|jgi:FAD/FMN-containing dehydrogenase